MLKNFNAIVFTGDTMTGNAGFIKYRKQTNIVRLVKYFNEKFPEWRYVTCYDRKTNDKTLITRKESVTLIS